MTNELTRYSRLDWFFDDFRFDGFRFLGRLPELFDFFVERQKIPEELVVDVGQRQELAPQLRDLQGQPQERLVVVVVGSRPGKN